MKQEDKELLFKDICGRLPYGVKCKSELFNVDTLQGIEIDGENTLFNFSVNNSSFVKQLYISEFKPYLFPLSSMTEEQEKEYNETLGKIIYTDGTVFDEDKTYHTFDFLNKNHFDYRGLIDMGLANDATELKIY